MWDARRRDLQTLQLGVIAMIGEDLGKRLKRGSILDLGARWFRARAGLREEGQGSAEHGHWDPSQRSWRFHRHSAEEPGREVATCR